MKLQVPPIVFYGVAAIALLVGFMLLTTPGNPDHHAGPLIGQPAPETTGTTADGKKINLADFKGKVVVVNFWATWCQPCRQEIPAFVKLEQKYRDKGVVFLGMVVNDDLEKAAAFAKEQSMVWPHIPASQELAKHYGGVEGVPETFVISRQGTIAADIKGITDETVLETEITNQL